MVNRPAESLHGAQANEETWVSTAKLAPEIFRKGIDSSEDGVDTVSRVIELLKWVRERVLILCVYLP